MIIVGRRSALLLLIGDAVAFVVALYATLFARYGAPPSPEVLAPYVAPFGFLFALWLLVYFASGLYGKRLALFPSRVPDVLLRVQVVNIVLAAVFFFLIPIFGIAPKTILAIYLVISLALIYLWRLVLYPKLSMPGKREPVAVIGAGEEVVALVKEVNGNPRYGIEIIEEIAEADIAQAARAYQVVPFEDLYEEVFDRVPLSKLEQVWFTENVAASDPAYYVLVKRASDIVGGVLMGLITLVLAPFISIANHVESGRRTGPLFLRQERFGKNGKHIRVYKFRSMQRDDQRSGEWTHEGENRVTKVGAFLRLTSLDEFPQFINVLKGEVSLVGPRNDILGLGQRLAQALPYYEARYLVIPGITGWAQINQQYEQGHLSPQSVEETKTRLAYDFYYLKHRSLGLDLVIALKTVKRMFFRLSST
jgi:lipopolysaccharide/colanic/teichoic acid biosynthesis glycosyltransferase